MIEIRINKEIGNYEPKFIASLTIRQTICLAIGAPLCVILYKVFSPLITPEVAGFLCFIPAAAAFFFGWRKPYGMPAEKFISSIFITTIIAPSNRKYKTVNIHEAMIHKLITSEEEEQTKQMNKATKRKPKKQPKKQSYKVSTDAVR